MFLGNAEIFIPTQTGVCIVAFLTEYWAQTGEGRHLVILQIGCGSGFLAKWYCLIQE